MERKLTAAATLFLCSVAPLYAQSDSPIRKYLTQPGFQWKCETQSNFQFCWEPSLSGNLHMAAARRSAVTSRAAILRTTGIRTYRHMIHVFFLASPDRMEELIGFHGEGRSRPIQHAIFFVPTPIRPDLTHELVHEIFTNEWGAAEDWIEEGVATFLAEGRSAHLSCLSMLVQHTLIPLAELVRAEWNPSIYSPEVTYRELGGFLDFLIRAYRWPRIKQIWQQGSVSIPAVTGKSLAELEREWHVQLERDDNFHPTVNGIINR